MALKQLKFNILMLIVLRLKAKNRRDITARFLTTSKEKEKETNDKKKQTRKEASKNKKKLSMLACIRTVY